MTLQYPAITTIDIAFIYLPVLLVGTLMLRPYLDVSIGKAFFISLASVFISLFIGMSMRWEADHLTRFALVLFLAEACFCGTAIIARLCLKWIAGKLSEGEKLPGFPGFKAWFHWSNLVFSAVFVATTHVVFQIPIFPLLLVTLGAFAAYPLLATASTPGLNAPSSDRTPDPHADLNADRERVLNMLETGKINAEEGAELLHAIGASAPTGSNPNLNPLNPLNQKFLLIGGALVLFGFLLPWFSINAVKQLAGVWGNTTFPGMEDFADNLPIPKIASQHISGGDIKHGLGWIVMFAGLAVSVISIASTTIEESTRRVFSLLALGIGTIIILYLLTSAFRQISIGLLLVIVGYGLLAAATFRQIPPGSESSSPSTVPEG